MCGHCVCVILPCGQGSGNECKQTQKVPILHCKVAGKSIKRQSIKRMRFALILIQIAKLAHFVNSTIFSSLLSICLSGIIPLENVQVRIVHTTTTTTAASHVKPTFGFAYHQPDHCFEIRPAVGAGDQVKACKRNHKNRFVQNPQSHFSLGIDARLASDQSEKSSPPPPQQSHRQQLERWVRAMQAAITHNPYLEMLLARRRKHA